MSVEFDTKGEGGSGSKAGSESEPYLGNAATVDGKPSRLWLWFVAAFLIQVGAWTTWFVIAAQHKVQEVPLATAR
jgi:hypothetical protein